MINIGRRLLWARTSAGLSQRDLAASVGCTSKTIRRYEKSITQPDTRMLQRIAAATNVPIQTLIGVGDNSGEVCLSDDASLKPQISRASGKRDYRATVTHHHASLGAEGRVPVRIVAIDGPSIIPTNRRAEVPLLDVQKTGGSICSLHAAPVPSTHHRLRSMLYPVSTLLIELSTHPDPLCTQLRERRFVDGRYVIRIGPSGLQVKDLRIRANGAISVSDIAGKHAFLCRPSHHHSIVIHAAVLGDVTPNGAPLLDGAPVTDREQGDLFSTHS
jgi:transcriptional regulator with XRE-family HTH domain